MTYRIPIRYKGEVVVWALVDECDFEPLRQFGWSLGSYGYAVRWSCEHGRTVSMHRQVVGLSYGDPGVVHHRNEEHLDNRRENLQVFANASEHARTPHPKALAAMRLSTIVTQAWNTLSLDEQLRYVRLRAAA